MSTPRTPDDPGGAEGSATGGTGDKVLRVAAVVIAVALGSFGLARPASVLLGGLSWLGFLLIAASGWGHIVVRVARVQDPGFGLRAAWGLAGALAVTGPLVAIGVCTRPVLLGLLGLGLAGFAWREVTTPVGSGERALRLLRRARAHPAVAAMAILIGALALLQIAGAVAAIDRNPWDDDLAYTPFVARLLDAGDLVEPFSFRRLGAYGGQTVLGALAGARGTLANVHLVDKGLCFAIVLLLLAGHARERGTEPVWTILIALVVVLLPDTSINTAPHWSGAALFLALYRTTVRGHWALVGVVGAATCTLRQNYLAVVVLFVAAALLVRLLASRRREGWAAAWSAERRRWLVTTGVAVATIVMWWVAAWRSSQTFLFPLVDGTWNSAISVTPEVMTWADELAFVAWASIETSPLVVVPILFVVLAFTRDERPGQPLRTLFVATILGFLLLVHGFAGTDPLHLWRYAFGFGVALAIALALEIGAGDERDVHLVPLGRWLLLASLVLQLLVHRSPVTKRFVGIGRDLREAATLGDRGDPAATAERARYRTMQAAIPRGASLVVMLDDPAHLDFARNRIANLDTPGFASPDPHLPAFQGAEPLRAYLLAQGYRYAAFVRSDRSRYFFRRPFWLWRLFNDGELFAAMSAYAMDAIDTFAELATTTTVLYDADGLVVLDLGAPLRPASTRAGPDDEATRRHAWVRELADREGLHDAWSLTTRGDLRFEDGVAPLAFVDATTDAPAWFELAPPRAPSEPLRGTAIRPLHRRAHLRVRGGGARRLVLRAAISLTTTHTRPRLDLSLDGEILGTAIADEGGRYHFDLVIPAARLAGGWHDLYLVFSSIAEPEKDVRDLRAARLELVEWTPLP